MDLNPVDNKLPPLIPPVTEEEKQQLAAVAYFLIYHNACLANVINDTMNRLLIYLSNRFREYHDEVLKALIGCISDFDIANCSSSMILEKLQPILGPYSLPYSRGSCGEFMENVQSMGQILELIAQDWVSGRNELRNGTEQVKTLVQCITDDLRVVYVNNPEYKYTVELLKTLEGQGVAASPALRNYCQACVIASQIEVNCMDHGLLLTLILVPQTNSFFLIDSMKSEINHVIPGISEQGSIAFQKALNDIVGYTLNDSQWTLCDYQSAVMNRGLVVVAVQRAFRAIDSLLSNVPAYRYLSDLIQNGLVNLNKAVICNAENAKTCLAPMPHDLVQAQELYDMVFSEKAHFQGRIEQIQKRRWGFNLATVKSYLENTRHTDLPLYTDDTLQLLNTILHM